MAGSHASAHVRLPRLLAVALLAGVAMAGCGGSSDDDAAKPPPSTGPTSTATDGSVTGTPSPSAPASAGTATPRATPPAAQSAWNSSPVEVAKTPPGQVRLVSLRSAHNTEGGLSFDRLVFEFTGGVPGYRAGYVDQVVQDGSGAPVPIQGQAFFEIVVHPAASYDDNGESILGSTSSGGGLPALVQYQLVSDFEGYLQIAIGLDDTVGFRVSELTGPDRLVFDFAA